METPFPATYSTLSAEPLTTLIAEKYGLPSVKCQFTVRGVNDTYLVETPGQRYILRVYRSSHRTLPQIGAEIELLLALKQAGVSVSYPIPDSAGQVIQPLAALEGMRYAVLFTYAPGQVVTALNKTQLQQLGTQMALFHNISSTIKLSDNRWNYNLDTTLKEPLKILEHLLGEDSEDYAWWQQASVQIRNKLAQLDTSKFSIGFCHYDFLPKNFHFDSDQITCFDFDLFGYGWLVNDIMTFWLHLSLEVHFRRMSQEAADDAYAIFLSAYRRHRDLTEEELAAVPYLSPGFWAWGTAFHTTHDQFYPFIQPAHLKLRTALVRSLTEKYWKTDR